MDRRVVQSPDQIPERWGAIAEDYESAFEGLSAQFAAEALRLLALEPGQCVIDVGAGTGAFSLMAARKGVAVLATDFAPGMIERLRHRVVREGLGNVRAEVMDGQALQIPDGSFDGAAAVLSLIFFPDIQRGMAELRRVLRPGGRAAVVCWRNPENLMLFSQLVRSIREVVPGFVAPPPVFARLSGAGLGAEMERAGFTAVEVASVKATLRIESPAAFWNRFTTSAPPLASLFSQLGEDKTRAVGEAYMSALASHADAFGGVPTVVAEASIGLGRAG